MPRVSVVVPTRQREALLPEALASVAAQTVSDWECLVCDDGSTDGTRALVEALARRDGRFRLLALPPLRRHGAVRNRGIEAASAPVVAFLDDDDLLVPEALALQLGALDESPAAPFVSGKVTRFGTAEGTWPRRLPRGPLGLPTLLRGNVVPLSTVAARRESLLAAGLFPATTEATPDYELWLRMVRRAPARTLDAVLARYRVHAGNMSARRGLEADELEALYARLEAEWDLPPRLLAPGRRGLLRTRARLARSPGLRLTLWLRSLAPWGPVLRSGRSPVRGR